ncbi:MAG: hypothetical protein ACXVNM_04460 [Bacteroidia bacterium]
MFLTALYFVTGLIGILNHEVWLDEAHHFLIAKDSVSLSDLIYNTRYEGHPILWSLLVYIITRFTDDILYMQLMNCLIMTMVCFLFLKHSRFNMVLNIVILCGYFFIYEYLVISRNYSLLVLALTILFISLQDRNKSKLFYVSLLLLSLTHVFGIIISLSVCLIFLFANKENEKFQKPPLIILIAAGLLVFWSAWVPADHFLSHYNAGGLLSYKRISSTASIFAKGFLPVPDITESIKWNSNFFINKLHFTGGLLGLFVFLIPAYFFRKNLLLLSIYLIPSIVICVFMHLSHILVSVRYGGIMFILFIYITAFLSPGILDKKLPIFFIISLSTLHLIAGLIMYTKDLYSEFSNSKKVSEFIKEQIPGDKIVIVSNFTSAPGICYYHHKKIYYAEYKGYGSYCKWNTWPFILNNDELTGEIKKVYPPNDTLILVLNEYYYKVDLKGTLKFKDKRFHYKQIKKFEGAMVNNENYTLFYIYSN